MAPTLALDVNSPDETSYHPDFSHNAQILGPCPSIEISPTLAVNDEISARLRHGLPTLPLGFGEAGLEVHPLLRNALARAAGANEYGPVAGLPVLRRAAAGYWDRRGLATSPDQVIAAPGSKALLFALIAAIGGDIALPRPSWVSYAAQATLANVTAHLIGTGPGDGGVPDPDRLEAAVTAARHRGRRIRAVLVTLPDNPTGTVASPSAIARLCQVAARHGLLIISDEIYRDLVHDDGTAVLSPAALAPDRTVLTSGVSKNLALGGWRLGVARMPDGPLGDELRRRLLAIGSEIWSSAAAPVQRAAAVAFTEPPELTERIAASRRLHGVVARAVAARFTDAGADVAPPQAGFYLYPGFASLAGELAARHGIGTGPAPDAELARFLLREHGIGVLPGSAFGDDPRRLRLRVATSLLYGGQPDRDQPARRAAALDAASTTGSGTAVTALPWIAGSLTHLTESLAKLAA